MTQIDYTKFGPKTLATKLEAAWKAKDKAAQLIYREATRGDQRFSEIREMLGASHPHNKLYNAKRAVSDAIERECIRRYGPNAVTFGSQWPTLLRTIKISRGKGRA
jgi:hypothetical protein